MCGAPPLSCSPRPWALTTGLNFLIKTIKKYGKVIYRNIDALCMTTDEWNQT